MLLLEGEFLFYFIPFISLTSQFLLRILKRIPGSIRRLLLARSTLIDVKYYMFAARINQRTKVQHMVICRVIGTNHTLIGTNHTTQHKKIFPYSPSLHDSCLIFCLMKYIKKSSWICEYVHTKLIIKNSVNAVTQDASLVSQDKHFRTTSHTCSWQVCPPRVGIWNHCTY